VNEPEEYIPPPPDPAPEPIAEKPAGLRANGNWADAPGPVKAALALDLLFVAAGVYIFLMGTMALRSPDGLIPCLIASFMGATYILVGIWLWNVTRWGEKGAQNAQVSLAILGICCFPVGSILAAMVFAGKGKAEVQAWYGE
jgi:hypothetical protein